MAADSVGLRVLDFLREVEEKVVLVVLDPADPGGCNERIEETASRFSPPVPTVVVGDVNSGEFVERAEGLKPELGILAWWPRILGRKLIAVPGRGWLNLHPSFLPYNRGKHPNFWCLVDGTPCGVSLHFVDDGIDSGPVVARREVGVSWEDTGETLYRKCLDAIVDLFEERYGDIRRGKAEPVVQSDGGTMHLAREIDEASRIDLKGKYEAADLLNILRARSFPPHPGAWFEDGGEKYEVRMSGRKVERKE